MSASGQFTTMAASDPKRTFAPPVDPEPWFEPWSGRSPLDQAPGPKKRLPTDGFDCPTLTWLTSRLLVADADFSVTVLVLVSIVLVGCVGGQQVSPGVPQDGRSVRPERRIGVKGSAAMGVVAAKRAPLRHEIGHEHVREVIRRLTRLRSHGRAEGVHAEGIPVRTELREGGVA